MPCRSIHTNINVNVSHRHIVLVSIIKQTSTESIVIQGTGFKGEPVINFEPPLWSPANYTLTVVSETELKLDLVEGSMWRKKPGVLKVKGINVGDGDVS